MTFFLKSESAFSAYLTCGIQFILVLYPTLNETDYPSNTGSTKFKKSNTKKFMILSVNQMFGSL